MVPPAGAGTMIFTGPSPNAQAPNASDHPVNTMPVRNSCFKFTLISELKGYGCACQRPSVDGDRDSDSEDYLGSVQLDVELLDKGSVELKQRLVLHEHGGGVDAHVGLQPHVKHLLMHSGCICGFLDQGLQLR